MSDIEQRLAALEQEVFSLCAIQDIQQRRFEYWYSLVDKDVARPMDCFTEDVFLDYGFGIEMTGQEIVSEFFGNLLGSENLIRQVPRDSNPQITILSDTEAKGRWLR